MSKKDTEEIIEEKALGTEEQAVNTLENLQVFFEKHKNNLAIGLVALLLIIAGIYYYTAIMRPNAEKTAQAEMFNAQYYFEQDSFQLALDGFEMVIDDHSSTKAGNLAKYYAGICAYNLKDYTTAIDYLKAYKAKDEVLGSLALGVLADAQAENGDTKAALSNYSKAANYSANEATAPFLLLKAGVAHEAQNDLKTANQLFNKIKKQFPNSPQARDIDKYIGRTQTAQ